MTAWTTLGTRQPVSLADARLQLHHAMQVLAAVGFAYVPAKEDFSHTNLRWHDGALVRDATIAGRDVIAGLRLASATLFIESDGRDARELPLAGRTLDQAFSWATEVLGELPGGQMTSLSRPAHDIPGHRIAGGQAFSAEDGALAELGRWFANADLALRTLATTLKDPTPVRCWPHHFDIATLETQPGADGSRSVGAGMTPGDGSYPEPYWYVTPWPYPVDAPTVTLPGGARWHTGGWTGAVLTAERTIEGDAEAQHRRVDEFLAAAVSACRAIVAGD